MIFKTDQPIYIPILHIRIHKEFETGMLKQVLAYLEKPLSTTAEGQQLRDTLQKYIAVNGFSHAYKAPHGRILSEMQRIWLANDDFCSTILWLWKSSQAPLFEQVAKWVTLEHGQAEVYGQTEATESFKIDELLSEWSYEFVKSATDIPLDAIKLALSINARKLAELAPAKLSTVPEPRRKGVKVAMNQQAMSSVELERISPVVGS